MMYSSQLWYPFLSKDIKILEQVQSKATKFHLNITTPYHINAD